MKRFFLFLILVGFLHLTGYTQNFELKFATDHKPVTTLQLPMSNAKYQLIFYEDFSQWPPQGWTFANATDSPGFIDGDGYAYHNDDEVDCADYMISPAITLPTNVDTIFLAFDQYEAYPTYYVKHLVLVLDNNDTSTANVLDTLYEGVGPTEWHTEFADLTSFAGQTIYIAFYYEGNYADEWSIDNVVIYAPDSLDITPVQILPEYFISSVQLKKASLKVKNIGYNHFSDSVTVSLSVLQDSSVVYSYETKIFLDMESNSMENIYLNLDATLDPGTYTMLVSTISESDVNSANDTLIQSLEIINPEYNATYDLYGYVAYDDNGVLDDKFVNIDPSNGSITDLSTNSNSVYGATFAWLNGRNVLFGLVYNNLVFINTADGSEYPLLPLHPLPDTVNIYGLAFDITSNMFYTVGLGDNGANILYSFDLENYELNYIGTMDNVTALLAIAINSNGDLYGIDISQNKLYTVNKTDATTQLVGELGIEINYLQDITFDVLTNTLYGALFYYSTSASAGLFTINTNTGAASLVGNNSSEITGLAYKINRPSSVTQTSGIIIAPNPATDYLIINNLSQSATVKIIDISGKVLSSQFVTSDNARIDVSALAPGVYMLKIMTPNGIFSHKFIKN